MRGSDLARAALLPVSDLGVLFTLVMFWLLVALVGAAGILGVWLAVIIVPALFRYLTVLVEEVGSGREPSPPGSEFFRWIGDTWSLFPALIAVLLAWGSYLLFGAAGATPTLVFLFLAGALYPALLGVLAITHSPLQSVNPVAIARLIREVGHSYWIAPVYLLVITTLSYYAQSLPRLVALFVELLLLFSLHALIGQLISKNDLVRNVDIPDAADLAESEIADITEKARNAALSHAYGFISRGNRDGGFRHIFDVINKESDVADAWAWFFKHLLKWEQKQHALYFAQHYVHDMLQHGEETPALKLIMRCRLIDETFKPRTEDMPAAVAAAESSGNIELATVLKRV